MVILRILGLSAFAPVASGLATSALILLGAASASAQSTNVEADVKGTACEAPTDENTETACATALLECAFVTSYGRTDEEKDRLYRGCIKKIVARYKQASDAAGDAVRREFSDGPVDRAATKAAEKKKAQEQAAAAAAQAKQQQVAQQRYDAVKQNCLTGQGTLSVTGTMELQGRDAVFLYSGDVVQPIADPDAVARGQCSVAFTRQGRDYSGTLPLAFLER